MARTTSQLLTVLERFLPPQMQAARPLLAGLAAQAAAVEAAGDDLADGATVAGADGIWLTLQAHGLGLHRAHGEVDADLRTRLRSPEQQLTPASILAAVNLLLASYTSDEAELHEHHAEGLYLDVDLWMDRSSWYDQHNAFTLVCPLVGDYPVGHSFFDAAAGAWLDQDLFFGDYVEHPIYATIAAAVERLRAAGVRWWLVVDP